MSPLGPPASEARVAAFEAQLGSRLPEDYRHFLLRYNGCGLPSPSGFRLAGKQGPYSDSQVQVLDSLHDGESANLETSIRWQRLPPGVIMIGSDPGGNGICLVIAGERRGQVWFWDHEQEPRVPDWSNMDLIAPSFDAFMRGLVRVAGDD